MTIRWTFTSHKLGHSVLLIMSLAYISRIIFCFRTKIQYTKKPRQLFRILHTVTRSSPSQSVDRWDCFY